MVLVWPFRLDSPYDILKRVLNLDAIDIGFSMGPMWGIYRIPDRPTKPQDLGNKARHENAQY